MVSFRHGITFKTFELLSHGTELAQLVTFETDRMSGSSLTTFVKSVIGVIPSKRDYKYFLDLSVKASQKLEAPVIKWVRRVQSLVITDHFINCSFIDNVTLFLHFWMEILKEIMKFAASTEVNGKQDLQTKSMLIRRVWCWTVGCHMELMSSGEGIKGFVLVPRYAEDFTLTTPTHRAVTAKMLQSVAFSKSKALLKFSPCIFLLVDESVYDFVEQLIIKVVIHHMNPFVAISSLLSTIKDAEHRMTSHFGKTKEITEVASLNFRLQSFYVASNGAILALVNKVYADLLQSSSHKFETSFSLLEIQFRIISSFSGI